MKPDKKCVIMRIVRKFGNWVIREQEMSIKRHQLLMKQGIEAYMKEQNLKICKQCPQEKPATLEE